MSIIEDVLRRGCNELGMEITPEQIEQFEKYAALLLEWNTKINLTAIVEPHDVAVKHFLDSVAVLREFSLPDGARAADIGTGAGFPGIPLKVVRPDLSVLLVDSLQKRVQFLNSVIEELEITSIETCHGRAEEVGQKLEYRETQDIVFSRAVSSLNILSELCLPLVQVGGFFLALKGPQMEEELKQAKQALKTLGGVVRDVRSYALPVSGDLRTLVVIEKVSPTPAKFPRRPGLPEKKPL